MTKVLHTADVHLAADEPARWEALETLLEMAGGKDVDVVTIGGDLFDQPGNVEELRPRLRNDLFADRPYEIVLIPGNHDREAYRGDVFFGDACTVVTEAPFDQWTAPVGDLRITALPYREQPDDDLLMALEDRPSFDGSEALLFHGSLDAPFDDAAGDEGTHRYFPVTTELLVELDFDYYLAGHYHDPHHIQFPKGAEFSYPGTPASIKSTETGRRHVSLLEPDAGLILTPLDTFHYVTRSDTVVPGEEPDLLEAIRDWADEQLVETAEGSVHVDGFIEMDEAEFHEQLTDAASGAAVTNETRAVSHVLSHPLFVEFREALDGRDWETVDTEHVERRTLEVFCQLSAEGVL